MDIDDEGTEATLEKIEAATRAVREMQDRAAAKAGFSMASDGVYRKPSMASIIHADGKARAGSAYGYQGAYEKGSFLKAVLLAGSRDYDEQRAGKATLLDLSSFEEPWGKATLGTTAATGGWIIPNSLVDQIVRPSTSANVYGGLVTARRGINAASVDVPFRSAAPARAVVSLPGNTKDNVDLAYNGYTATMYTLARIYDLQNSFIRHSQGAAEEDVLAELAAAFGLGEAHYIREGTGSSEPFGFMTALNAGPATFITSHSPAAATLAGSVGAAIGKAAAALLGRSRRPEAAILSALGYAELLNSGTDTAGFFWNGGPDSVSGFPPNTLISPWGIPVLCDPAFASDDLVVGQFSALKVYYGESYRVDTSDQAGTRWDLNQTGFRGEGELGLDARAAVYAGAFQLVQDILS